MITPFIKIGGVFLVALIVGFLLVSSVPGSPLPEFSFFESRHIQIPALPAQEPAVSFEEVSVNKLSFSPLPIITNAKPTLSPVPSPRPVPDQEQKPAPTVLPISPPQVSVVFTPVPLFFVQPPPLFQPTPTSVPVNRDAILRSVVKIECKTEDGKARHIGSGFVVKERTVVSAAHILMHAGADGCTVMFPESRRPAHVFTAVLTESAENIRKRHDETGVDIAFLELPELVFSPLAAQMFVQGGYPVVPYPVCTEPHLLGDELLHFGYPSNYAGNSYLAETPGVVLALADISGVSEQLSENQSYAYKSPLFVTSNDESRLHPYLASRAPVFYGDSGGLSFNTTDSCIVGPIRGGTVGGGVGENFSIVFTMGSGGY